jgi:predicted transcriptional regulator of viral defense system
LIATKGSCYDSSVSIEKRRGLVTRDSPAERALGLLEKAGLARSRDLERAGVSRIRRLRDRGLIERVGRGLYRGPRAPFTERGDLAEAARLVPGGVVCLLSALRFHRLTTQNPFEVWLAIHRKAWRPRLEHPPLRFVYLSGAALSEGVEEHDVGGVTVRVFSAAKTVADCFKFRNKIGTDVAVEALRAYRRAHPKGLEAVWRYAEIDRVTRVIQPYLEAVG